jgi:hypothetical protein
VKCRHCKTRLKHIFVDLGYCPPSNGYLTRAQLNLPELYYPLRVQVCSKCFLVQTEDYVASTTHGLFDENYAYFSSTSTSFLKHAKDFCLKMIDSLKLGSQSLVIEVASNDGYLLKNFIGTDIHTLGIEPTKSTAEFAMKLGINVVVDFFGESLAKKLVSEGNKADLLIGNNVYAHVPDINDFTVGIKLLLKPNGVVTLEIPHVLELINHNEFDTIYHEHFSYHSLNTIKYIFECHGLRIFNVESLKTHGGSLRVFGCLKSANHDEQISVSKMLEKEIDSGLQVLETYTGFQRKSLDIKLEFIKFLVDAKRKGKIVVAYGAAAKGNTLLNFCGIKSDLISAVFDAAEAKQGKFLPGSHIPIFAPDQIPNFDPDYVIILPWNLKREIKTQLSKVLDKNVRYLTVIPELREFT